MRYLFNLVLVAFLLYGSQVYAQPDPEKLLADQYQQNGEFEKALPLYEKLIKKYPESKGIYKNYISVLSNLGQYDKAEKEIRKLMKADPANLVYRVDLGNLYKIQGQKNKATQEFDKVINNITNSESPLIELAGAFTNIDEYDYALEVYKEGRKVLNNPIVFGYEIAELYELKKDFEKMIVAYIDIIEVMPSSQDLETVEGALQPVVQDDKYYDFIKEELYKRIQKSPGNIFFSELLIWALKQNKNFKAALVQVKALDKRMKRGGTDVLDFAEECKQIGYYDIAIEANKYVVDNALVPTYRKRAEQEILLNRRLKIENDFNYTQADLLQLKADYENFISKGSQDEITANAIRDLAILEAFYLHNTDAAIGLLKQIENIVQISHHFKAEAKITLGDVLLFAGDKWEAILLYSQVDKAFKDEAIGDMAKYKTALVSYYTGEFEWAQTQLEVLKGSTSKFISNDALQLSTFIMDNLGLDTTSRPLELFANAELLIYQNKNQEALEIFQQINKEFPGHSLDDDILFKRAKISLKNKDVANAVQYLEKIVTEHPTEILIDDAIFLLATIYEEQNTEIEKAKEYYLKIMTDHKDSIYFEEARKRYRKLRGDKVN